VDADFTCLIWEEGIIVSCTHLLWDQKYNLFASLCRKDCTWKDAVTVQWNVTVAVSTDHEQTMNLSFSFLWHWSGPSHGVLKGWTAWLVAKLQIYYIIAELHHPASKSHSTLDTLTAAVSVQSLPVCTSRGHPSSSEFYICSFFRRPEAAA
jgi:hypothetical protein